MITTKRKLRRPVHNDKALPENGEAEQSVLGGVFACPSAIYAARQRLSPNDFYSHRNRIVFQAMIDLSEKDQGEIDVLNVADFLRGKGLLDQAGGIEYLSELEENIPTAEAVPHHANIVKEKAILRSLVRVGQELADYAIDEAEPAKSLMTTAQDRLFGLSLAIDGGTGEKHVLSPAEWAQESFCNAAGWADEPNEVRGIATGFNRLDMIIRGLKPVNIISATTGEGKTALGLNVAANIGVHQKIACLYLNYEMDLQELELRIQAMLCGIPINNIFCGQYNDKYPFTKIGKTSQLISDGKLFISGNQPKNINTTIALIHRYSALEKIKVVFVDYLGEIEPDAIAEKENSEYRTFGRWVQMLKSVCASLGVKLVLLAQLNREGEDNPKLSKVGGSWKIAQKADVFLIIKKEKGEPCLYVAKNRNGKARETIDIDFNKDTQRIVEI